MLLGRWGPRKLAMLAGCSRRRVSDWLPRLHWHSLALLYAGYGVIGGTGLGLGYVTPVATAASGSPIGRASSRHGRHGLRLGALLMSRCWPGSHGVDRRGLVRVFAILGGIFLAWTIRWGPSAEPPPATSAGLDAADGFRRGGAAAEGSAADASSPPASG